MIAFENVAYSYGGAELLSEVSLRLAPGSFHFLTGPSGSGKVDFLKLCYAELRPTAGRVSCLTAMCAAFRATRWRCTRRRIGMVHQDCQFLDHLPVTANVALPLTVSGRETAARRIWATCWTGSAWPIWPTRCRRQLSGANVSARRLRVPSSWRPT